MKGKNKLVSCYITSLSILLISGSNIAFFWERIISLNDEKKKIDMHKNYNRQEQNGTDNYRFPSKNIF